MKDSHPFWQDLEHFVYSIDGESREQQREALKAFIADYPTAEPEVDWERYVAMHTLKVWVRSIEEKTS
jgi:hypothetical protein